MIKNRLVIDSHKIVPKHSACLDRYTSIGIHANHMDMTRFLSDQDPNYRNVLFELRRLVPPNEQQTKVRLPLVTFVSPETQGESQYHGTGNESSSTMERGQDIVHEEGKPHRSARSVNTFFGTFNTNGGKMIQGSEFNSGGAPMTF
jgi:hypothetical protein